MFPSDVHTPGNPLCCHHSEYFGYSEVPLSILCVWNLLVKPEAIGGLYAVALWRGCRSASASARVPSWPPVPRPRLRRPRLVVAAVRRERGRVPIAGRTLGGEGLDKCVCLIPHALVNHTYSASFTTVVKTHGKRPRRIKRVAECEAPYCDN